MQLKTMIFFLVVCGFALVAALDVVEEPRGPPYGPVGGKQGKGRGSVEGGGPPGHGFECLEPPCGQNGGRQGKGRGNGKLGDILERAPAPQALKSDTDAAKTAKAKDTKAKAKKVAPKKKPTKE